MEENVNLQEQNQLPDCNEANLQPDISSTNEEEAEPKEMQEGFVEVKYNKVLKKLTLSEAATLAQKGMKFESLLPTIDKLKSLSKTMGMTVDDYISHLEEGLELKAELREIQAEFPQITSLDELPQEVKAAAKLKGTGLLFEHLLYQHRLRRAAQEELSRKEQREAQSLGSVLAGSRTDATYTQFLKGVWGN